MPPMEEANLTDYAVLWEITEFSDQFGNPVVSNPVEIACRWEDGFQQIEGPDSQILSIEATVAVLINIPIGSILWKGKLEDLPHPINSLKKVVMYDSASDLKGRVACRYVMLNTYNNSVLPAMTGT